MRVISVLSILGFVLLLEHCTAARSKGCAFAWCQKDLVNVNSQAKARGDLTDSYTSSNVDATPYGSRASVSNQARAHGYGLTGTRSAGRIDTESPFRSSILGTSSSADAFGTRLSYSQSNGCATSSNGQGSGCASSRSGGSGYGSSSSSTTASAGQMIRHRRSVDVSAGTDEAALGDFTETFGESEVLVGPCNKALGEAHHGAKGLGNGRTGAKSQGGVEATYRCSKFSAESAAAADAFGDWSSYSETTGDAELFGDLTKAGALSRAGSSGSLKSSSRTRASASSSRQKRHTINLPCGRPNCGVSGAVNAETAATATGGFTDTFGHSSTNTDMSGSSASFRHGARGHGIGLTGAKSAGRILSQGSLGKSLLGSEAAASACGNLGSFSETQGNANRHNGLATSGSSATAGARGLGVSCSKTSASAGGTQIRPIIPREPVYVPDRPLPRPPGAISGLSAGGARSRISGRGCRSRGARKEALAAYLVGRNC